MLGINKYGCRTIRIKHLNPVTMNPINNMFVLAFLLVIIAMVVPIFLPCRRAPEEANLKPMREVRWASFESENFTQLPVIAWIFMRTVPARLTFYEDFCVIGYVGFLFQYLGYCVIPYSTISNVEHTWRSLAINWWADESKPRKATLWINGANKHYEFLRGKLGTLAGSLPPAVPGKLA
jgi:hypothetical protein